MNSSIHTPRFSCDDCDRLFGSQSALNQHMKSSIHTPEFPCDDCNRQFSSQSALDQHLSSSIHAPELDITTLKQSPLDSFFSSYPDFPYVPSNPPQQEYSRLRKFYKWKRDDPDSDIAWQSYRSALVTEFNRWYRKGNNDLGDLQSLCRAVGTLPTPQTVKECRHVSVLYKMFYTDRLIYSIYQNIRGQYINLKYLIEIQCKGGGRVTVFCSLDELRNYTKETSKYFPKGSLESGAILRHLLCQIF